MMEHGSQAAKANLCMEKTLTYVSQQSVICFKLAQKISCKSRIF